MFTTSMLYGKMPAMNQFSQWLDTHHGMATKIANAVGVGRASISNCKTGRLPMPPGWMESIVKLSKGRLTHKYLLSERERIRSLKNSFKAATS